MSAREEQASADRARAGVGWPRVVGGLLLGAVVAWLVGSTAVGFGTALLKPLLGGRELFDFPAVAWPLGLVAGLGAALGSLAVRRSIRFLLRVLELTCLLVLPVWGLLLDLGLPSWEQPCEVFYAPLAAPDVVGLYPLYAVCLLAYAVARRRPGRLRPWAEALVAAGLLGGVLLCLALAVQVGPTALLALPFAFVGGPALAPACVLGLFAGALFARLVRRGREARAGGESASGVAWGLPLALPLVGLWAVAQRLVFERWPQAIFTETAEWVLSQRTPPPGGCHYLCTVAARGHPRLVRPLRPGVRRGRPILVNRQLALANAFEDLLHSRWPRLGRVARTTYDRLGLPMSRVIRSPWAADAVYLAMKPFEWSFALALLLLDPGEPEARIERMYRP
jgi:hypothetical protein